MDSPGWSPWFIPQLLQSHHRRIKLATSQGLDDANLFPRCFPGGGCPLSTAVRKIASGSRRRRTVEDRWRSSELKRCCFLNYGGDTTQCYSIYPGSLLYIYIFYCYRISLYISRSYPVSILHESIWGVASAARNAGDVHDFIRGYGSAPKHLHLHNDLWGEFLNIAWCHMEST